VQRAGGNPFFIEEVVKSSIDEGAVVLKEGLFETTDKIHAMSIPNTINDVLMARIDRLDEKSRNLLKIASVIGRNFFRRILLEVAGGNGETDSRLSHLEEIQLIREGRRMGEAEYGFNHALAQEAIYGSILLQKKRKLHFRVADAIEKLFNERLHEFYGMLAYHYSKAEDLEKAEEYMLKTGEEAMKSSASAEALHYFERAMEIYILKYGDTVDSNKIADLEENIATAFHHKGYFVEAVEYFDRSIKSRGKKVQRNRIIVIIKLIIDLFVIILFLYLPGMKKRIPSDQDNQAMARNLKIGMALAYVDIKRVFIENIRNAVQILKLDVSKSQICFDALTGASVLFSITGISFKISKKILGFSKTALLRQNEKAPLSLHFFSYIDSIHNCLVGKWDYELNENIVYSALKKGEFSTASSGLVWWGYMSIERGDFERTEKIANMLNSIGDEYGFTYAKLDFFCLNTKLCMKSRETDEGSKYADEAISLLDEINLDMRKVEILSMKSRLLILKNDLEDAEKTLEEIQNIIEKIGKNAILTNYYSDYLMAVFACNLARFENSVISDDEQSIYKFSWDALKSGKMAAKHCGKKVATDRTEAFNFLGRYYWLVNNQAKALKWWDKAITEGERLGARTELSSARTELSRTYFEVGKRLRETKSGYKDLKGVQAGEFLKKAKMMFEELYLKRDLAELKGFSA
jgi:tetratricopeptide (TPR) repeat protein